MNASDNNGMGSEKASQDNTDNLPAKDNAIIDGLEENVEINVEAIVQAKKPVLTQQIIMELVESQASSIRTPSNVGWCERSRKREHNTSGSIQL